MSFEWNRKVWYVCDERLRITNADSPLTEAPADWPGAESDKAKEEVLETLLILNLQTLLDEDLRFLFRAGDYWGLQDITALDPLGRVHLFELKKGKINNRVPQQLASYLLPNLFAGGREYARWTWQLNRDRLDATRWELYYAAALANERTSNIGRKYVNETRGDDQLTESEWKALYKQNESGALITRALLAKAEGRCASPTLEQVADWGAATRAELVGEVPAMPHVWTEPGGVIWLVGRTVDADALEEIRKWRQAGVDARAACVDARQSQSDGRWIIRVTRENYPERRALLQKVGAELPSLVEHVAVDGPGPLFGHKLRIKLYEEVAASKANKPGGGGALGSDATVQLRPLGEDTPSHEWRVRD